MHTNVLKVNIHKWLLFQVKVVTWPSIFRIDFQNWSHLSQFQVVTWPIVQSNLASGVDISQKECTQRVGIIGSLQGRISSFQWFYQDFAIDLTKFYCILQNLKIFATKYDNLRISLRAEFTILRAFFDLFCKIFTPERYQSTVVHKLRKATGIGGWLDSI